MGTPHAAVPSLERILRDGHEVVAVYTQPDKPAGRGNKLNQSAVKLFALENNLKIYQPTRIKTAEALETFVSHNADVAVVVAYGRILPETFLQAFPKGAINVHFSLLPKYRGAAPVNWAIVQNEQKTGVTTMRMDAGLDTGAMLAVEKLAIAADDTSETLTSKLAQLGARMIVEALRDLDRVVRTPQPEGATYAHKLNKSEAWLDWSSSAAQLARKVRAFNPFPIASSLLNGTTIRIWRAVASADRVAVEADVGVVKAADAYGLRVVCGAGELLITELQRAGGKRVTAREFLSGFPVEVGSRFVSPHAVATE